MNNFKALILVGCALLSVSGESCKRIENEPVYLNQAIVGGKLIVYDQAKGEKFIDGYDLVFTDSRGKTTLISTNDILSGTYTVAGDTMASGSLKATIHSSNIMNPGIFYTIITGMVELKVAPDGSVSGTYSAKMKDEPSKLVELTEGKFSISAAQVSDKTVAKPIKDIDGNSYKTVVIGHQVWMAENLRTTRFADGIEITEITNDLEWFTIPETNAQKYYCYYKNDSVQGDGALYTFGAAVNNSVKFHNQGACPDGWHLPNANDWAELIEFVRKDGYTGKEGLVLKDSLSWDDPGKGIDKYGFALKADGWRRHKNGLFYDFGKAAMVWVNDGVNENGFAVQFYLNEEKADASLWSKANGHTIRCMMD